MACPYCRDNKYGSYFLPSTLYNNKLFKYVKCKGCGVVYVNPLPDDTDYDKMYPTGYQSGLDKTILTDLYKKLPGLRFSYGYQFDLINKVVGKKAEILDYGCGNANFIVNAMQAGFICDGAEFNPDHVNILKQNFSQASFFTINEILATNDKKYDVIRLSNVLEHLDNPNLVMVNLISKLKTKGILLIEGPVECNRNLAFFTRKVYFKLMNLIRGEYQASHAPTHITFTNANNQLEFFNKLKLDCVEYKITEAEWPYPDSFSTPGLGAKVKYCIARISIFLSSFSKSSGNTFIYAGRRQ